MMARRSKYLLLLETECYLKSKEAGDLLKLYPEAAIEKFLAKGPLL